ncbi:MAG TPA: hypothetical protein VJZ68_02720 [Nitrososphaera sp.]|nr:hypothetical protein [Nitrososphaera sp.]
MAKGVIEFDNPPMQTASESTDKRDDVYQILETGDYYFGLQQQDKVDQDWTLLEIIEVDMQ